MHTVYFLNFPPTANEVTASIAFGGKFEKCTLCYGNSSNVCGDVAVVINRIVCCQESRLGGATLIFKFPAKRLCSAAISLSCWREV